MKVSEVRAMTSRQLTKELQTANRELFDLRLKAIYQAIGESQGNSQSPKKNCGYSNHHKGKRVGRRVVPVKV